MEPSQEIILLQKDTKGLLLLGFGLVTCLHVPHTMHGCTVSPLSPVGGIAFSLGNSTFLPQNSLLTHDDVSSSSTVVCHSDGAFPPSWLDSGDMTVTTNITFPVHQVDGDNTTRLVVTDINQFTNGVYQCMSTAGNMSSLGIFIRPPGTHVMADASIVWWQQSWSVEYLNCWANRHSAECVLWLLLSDSAFPYHIP